MYSGRQDSKMATPWCIHLISSSSLEWRWNLCVWWIVALLIRLHYVKLPCHSLESIGNQKHCWPGKSTRPCCKLSMWATEGGTATLSKSWEPFLANSQQESGHLITGPTRNWIQLTICMKEDPEFQIRIAVWPTLECSLERPWAWPRQDPACLDSWPMETWDNKYVWFSEAKFVVISCVAMQH